MPKKSIREMNIFERTRYSLSSKLFHAIVIFAVILSVIAVAFGFYLYSDSVRDQYSKVAQNIARSSYVLFSQERGSHFIDEVLEIYENNKPQSTEESLDKEYRKLYKGIENIEFSNLREVLFRIQLENDVDSIYIGIYDRNTKNMVFVMDSDHSSFYCPPGKIEKMSPEEIECFEGDKNYIFGTNDREGYYCTSWTNIRKNSNYIVSVLCDINMQKVADLSRKFLIQYFILLGIATIFMAYLITRKTKKMVVSPIVRINEAARQYMVDKGNDINDTEHFKDLNIKTGDEIESLALIMADMEKDINDYIINIEKVTSEKEKISAELNIASQIQDGMLPSTFPAFPERKEFDIYASMDPAKEVGGDFYDFYFIDDNNLALVIADVSGKGIPAALFMMASKILISNYTMMGIYDPAIILESVNNSINKSNPAEMFVTVWLGIINLETGVIKASNAGHEYPCIYHKKEGRFELFKDKHGLVIGGMEGSKYKNYEIKLEPEDTLFVYTDGVPEATNKDDELFGTDRLLEVLNNNKDAPVEDLLDNVRKAIDDFVLEAPQFDDITMLGFKYMGKERINELTVEATIENVEKVTDFVNERLEELDCPIKAQTQIDVAIDELFSNIANYAYHPEIGPATVRVEVDDEPMAVIITFIDNGKPYDPLKNEDPDITLSAEERGIGGLGIFLVKKTMDELTYEYKDGQNILKIKKHI